MIKENLSTEEAAKYLCVSLSKLWKMCCKKELKYYKVGRLNVFKVHDLEDYLEANKVMTSDELKEQAENNLLTNQKSKHYGRA